LLSIILLSRLLTAEAYGYYAMMLALALLGQTTAFTWL
jgi:O-antigen/teichoic acid export membrane protein